jgi:hypothetical protein
MDTIYNLLLIYWEIGDKKDRLVSREAVSTTEKIDSRAEPASCASFAPIAVSCSVSCIETAAAPISSRTLRTIRDFVGKAYF